jgi:hypothetical protein
MTVEPVEMLQPGLGQQIVDDAASLAAEHFPVVREREVSAGFAAVETPHALSVVRVVCGQHRAGLPVVCRLNPGCIQSAVHHSAQTSPKILRS